MAQNPTFGCGAFLPGEGPGNFPEFTGGGTIDAGDGGGPDDTPTPVDPGDPIEPQDPNKVCACIPDIENPAENVTYPPGGIGVAIVTRVYQQTCTEFPNRQAADLEIDVRRQILRNQSPPPVLDGWEQIGTATISGDLGKDCKFPNGECGLYCPPITVTSRWRRRRDSDDDIDPSGTNGGGDRPGGAAGPPPAPTGPCKCIVDYIDPGSPTFVGKNAQGCFLYEVRWTYSCRPYIQGDPLAELDKEPWVDWQPPAPGGVAAGWDVTITFREGPTGTCRDVGPAGSPGQCGGDCGFARIGFKVCPPPASDIGLASPPPTGPGDGDGEPGGNVITPGPPLGGGASPPPTRPRGGNIDIPFGASPPPFEAPGDGEPGGGGITPGPDSEGFPTGTGLLSESTPDENSLRQSVGSQDIDLNDPEVIREILKLKPDGIQDSIVAFNKTPKSPTLVTNDTEFTELFNKRIDSNIYYILKNRRNSTNWDSTKTAGVTIEAVLSSLKPEIKNILNNIRNYDGTELTQRQIFSMIGSRILDGSIGEITKSFLQSLADDSERRVPTTITRSSIDKVNEVAALILIDKHKIPLDTSKLAGREKQVFKNYKILSSDIDKFIPITIEGITRRFYVNDDDTFVDRSTLSIKDGDYFDVTSGSTVTRLYAGSEKDHAFLIPEDIRQRAITLLGGESGRTLSVSGDKETASGIEFDYSLSSPRQPFYVLSAVLSSVNTSPSFGGSFLLKNTTLRYQLMDTSTPAGLDATNEFIKYKANKRIFVLDHEDLIIDYIENTEAVSLTQTDILFNSPKVNKTIPLLVRQIPFYIMIYPTNRSEYNIFNDKSRILEISKDGAVSRELKCKTHINPEFTQSQTNKFIRYKTVGRDAVNVFGETDPQTRISFIDENDEIFKTGFRKEKRLVPASDYDVDRPKTGFRLLREIINELDTNYILSTNGVGKTLTEFDAFSRLNLKQYNTLSRLENFNEINRAVSNGLINDVKLIPPIENADNRIVIKKTQLLQRKTTAGPDTFKPIKATSDGRTIVSPDEKGVGGFGPAT